MLLIVKLIVKKKVDFLLLKNLSYVGLLYNMTNILIAVLEMTSVRHFLVLGEGGGSFVGPLINVSKLRWISACAG